MVKGNGTGFVDIEENLRGSRTSEQRSLGKGVKTAQTDDRFCVVKLWMSKGGATVTARKWDWALSGASTIKRADVAALNSWVQCWRTHAPR